MVGSAAGLVRQVACPHPSVMNRNKNLGKEGHFNPFEGHRSGLGVVQTGQIRLPIHESVPFGDRGLPCGFGHYARTEGTRQTEHGHF